LRLDLFERDHLDVIIERHAVSALALIRGRTAGAESMSRAGQNKKERDRSNAEAKSLHEGMLAACPAVAQASARARSPADHRFEAEGSAEKRPRRGRAAANLAL